MSRQHGNPKVAHEPAPESPCQLQRLGTVPTSGSSGIPDLIFIYWSQAVATCGPKRSLGGMEGLHCHSLEQSGSRALSIRVLAPPFRLWNTYNHDTFKKPSRLVRSRWHQGNPADSPALGGLGPTIHGTRPPILPGRFPHEVSNGVLRCFEAHAFIRPRHNGRPPTDASEAEVHKEFRCGF